MLRLIFGKDTYRAIERLREIKNEWLEKGGKLGIFEFSPANFSFKEFENLIKGQNLIRQNFLIVCHELFEDGEQASFLLSQIPEMAASQNLFVFYEDAPEENIVKVFKGSKAKIEKFSLLAGEKLRTWLKNEIKKRNLKVGENEEFRLLNQFGGNIWALSKALFQIEHGYDEGLFRAERVNVFNLVDAILEGKRRKALGLFYKAIEQGIEPEEVFRLIWWGFKAMYLVKTRQNPQKQGLKPFTISKCERIAYLFTPEKLEQSLKKLIFIQERNWSGLSDLALELEYFILRGQTS